MSIAFAHQISQGNWNLTMRDMERDIIPMCKANGITIGTPSLRIPDQV